jgi:hypothetical protein
MPTLVLSAICLVVALVLSAVNLVTAPLIEAEELRKANAALAEVLPGDENFTKVETLPAGVAETVKEVSYSSLGYVFKMQVNGFKPGLVIMVGVDNEGKISGTKCITTAETLKAEYKLDGAYNGKTGSVAPIIITKATYTSKAYHTAVVDALAAFNILTQDGGN